MSTRHIPGALFEEVFWDTVDHFTLIDNFASCGNYELVVETVMELWEIQQNPQDIKQSKGELFAQRMVEVCSASGGSIDFLVRSTDYVPCWLVFQILSEIQLLVRAVVRKGFYGTSSQPKVEYEPVYDNDDSYYEMNFPSWLSEAINNSTNDGLTIEERMEKACMLHDDDKTDMVTFTECAVCCVLKPDIWVPRRIQSPPERKPIGLADISKYREI